MLTELRIANLGVIEDLSLILPAGSVAVTGETGAGKTMVVGAIQLLMGGRAEPEMVRIGADEAIVEGRFIDRDGNELVARRVIPSAGRSRAYLDGGLATATALQDAVGPLIDLHGQHAQQSLLKSERQRHALDRFGGIDRAPLRNARADVAAIDAALADLGGDETERARQIDLLRYQLDELEAAALNDPEEDEALREEEERLAHVFDDQVAAAAASDLLGGDGPAAEALASAAAALGDAGAFRDLAARLQVLQEELTSLGGDVRAIGENAVDDPERRETVRQRRQLLVELRRKYGPTLTDVMAYASEMQQRLLRLESHADQVNDLLTRREAALARLEAESRKIRTARTKAAEPLSRAVEAELARLAMPNATVQVTIGGDAGDDVAILLAPNPGLPALPVGKNASGGELSRTMLALRLVLSGGPPIKVFDEVDAGIGGETARAVGASLANLGRTGQIFVVTHLPQVAALTNHHVVIDKRNDHGLTSSQARLLSDEERIIEVSRMLSGSPDSVSAREHAEELLAGRAGSGGS